MPQYKKYTFHVGDDYLTIHEDNEPLMSLGFPSVQVIKSARKIINALNSRDDLLEAAKAGLCCIPPLSNSEDIRLIKAAIAKAEGK